MIVLYNSQILKCYGWARPLTVKLELWSAANRFQDGFVWADEIGVDVHNLSA